jgi:hypothetical protein
MENLTAGAAEPAGHQQKKAASDVAAFACNERGSDVTLGHCTGKAGAAGTTAVTVEVNAWQPTFATVIHVTCFTDAQRLDKPLPACHR